MEDFSQDVPSMNGSAQLIVIYNLVGALEHDFYFSIYWK